MKGDASFHLNDQVSKFLITVNLYSSKGKYAFAMKSIGASKLYYQNVTMPEKMRLGDMIGIPINVTNKGSTKQTIDVKVDQYYNRDSRLASTFT